VQIPQSLTAGDTWSWTDSLGSYPAPTWVLTYYFRGPQSFSIAGTASGTDHALAAVASDTSNYKAGTYDWIARVSSGALVYTVDTGRLTVEPNLANAAVEFRSFWRQVLDELEPVIINRAGTDQLSMSIAGRSLSRMTWDELLSVYDRAKLEVAGENGDTPGRVYYRFGAP
jgi:hypothetical protein